MAVGGVIEGHSTGEQTIFQERKALKNGPTNSAAVVGGTGAGLVVVVVIIPLSLDMS